MNRHSSMFSDVQYDSKSGILSVKYKSSGKIYTHSIPQAKYDAMMKAESLGKYFNEHIRPHHPGKERKD